MMGSILRAHYLIHQHLVHCLVDCLSPVTLLRQGRLKQVYCLQLSWKLDYQVLFDCRLVLVLGMQAVASKFDSGIRVGLVTSLPLPALCLLAETSLARSSLCLFSSASLAFFARISSLRCCILQGFYAHFVGKHLCFTAIWCCWNCSKFAGGE